MVTHHHHHHHHHRRHDHDHDLDDRHQDGYDLILIGDS